MANRFQRKGNKPWGGKNSMSNCSHRNRSPVPSYEPCIPNYNNSFMLGHYFPPAQCFQNSDPLFAERTYLLSSLQHEDACATSLAASISGINARMASKVPIHPREARMLRKRLISQSHKADISMREEMAMLQRLGEVTFMIQQRQRWGMVERERSLGIGMRMGPRIEVGRDNHVWGWSDTQMVYGWNWQGQQAPSVYTSQSQGHYGGQQWIEQISAPTSITANMAPSAGGGGFTVLNGDQPPTPVDYAWGWGRSQVYDSDAAMPQSPWATKSDSMLELSAGLIGRRKTSAPSLCSEPRTDGSRHYLGYYSPHSRWASDQ